MNADEIVKKHSKIIDLTGKKFGDLIVSGLYKRSKNGKCIWECKCKCGNICYKWGDTLRRGKKPSCGCGSSKLISNALKKHGMFGTNIYKRYYSIKNRCYNKRDKNYKNYGARGITMCTDWVDEKNGFLNFYNLAIKNGYKKDLTIDRIDNNKGYYPENCRWVNYKEQVRNRRNSLYLKTNKGKEYLKDFCERVGIKYINFMNSRFRQKKENKGCVRIKNMKIYYWN